MEMATGPLNIPEAKALSRLKNLGFTDPKGAIKNLKLLAPTPLADRFEEIIDLASKSPSPSEALNNLETIIQEIPEDTLFEFLKGDNNLERLLFITGSSPFLSGIIAKEPQTLHRLFCRGGMETKKGLQRFVDEIQEECKGAEDLASFERGLRIYRQREFLRLGARDLLGLAAMEETTGELSDFADAMLSVAYQFALKKLRAGYGAPGDSGGHAGLGAGGAGFAVIGLGKLGGRELNYSSDIDIMYITSSDQGESRGVEGKEGSKITMHEFFKKLAVMITRLISTVTAEGIVFRVDLDLRPEGPGGGMVTSLRSAETYYESWGQSWERAALIKARVVAGDTALGESFIAMTRPFVFRKHLDFTAIEEIRGMKEKIDLSLLKRNPDTVDVKLGAGGIREIEFFCQALQLIHGGRVTEIRTRGTLKTLARLRAKGLVAEADASTLHESYEFLRNLEHRIQIREARQTQAIPARAEEVQRIARMMGVKDKKNFWGEYKRVTSSVHDCFRALFYRSEKGPEVPREIKILFSPETVRAEALEILAGLGFKDREGAYKHLRLLKEGLTASRLSPGARVMLEKLTPTFLSKALASADPDMALAHLERFLSRVRARTTFYSLLLENPGVTEELLKIFGASEFLSRGIIEHPENLDNLLSSEIAIPYKTREVFMEEVLPAVMDPSKDYEERLDTLRRLRNQEIMRIGIQDVAGVITPFQVSAQITSMAETALEAGLRAALAELERVYARPEGPRFAILGLGKLGGRELIYGSDLDIVFVYDRGDGEVSGVNGDISIHEFFVKLCQRIISVLTLKTKEGAVFNVDTRLRPSGSSGPLVLTGQALLSYHRAGAAVWERQAFIRTRAVAGDREFGGELVEGLKDIIFSMPLNKEDVEEMLRIRQRMVEEEAGEDGSRYNIKTGPGGIVDIEFLVQALQLKWAGTRADLRTPVTLRALSRLFKEGALSPEDYKTLRDAYNFYRLLEMRLRVVHDRPGVFLSRDPERLRTLARASGGKGENPGKDLLRDYGRFRSDVREIYTATLEGLLQSL